MSTNVVSIQQSGRMREEGGLWIARLDRGLTQIERRELQAWVALDVARKETLFQMASVWDSMDSLSRLAALFPEHKAEFIKSGVRVSTLFAVAASICLCMVMCFASLLVVAPSSLPDGLLASLGIHSFEKGVYETGVGEHSTVRLVDGSELVLNTNTTIRVRYHEDARLLYLDRGEIHIEVAHDSSRPLSVIVGDKVVQAIGTAFNVERMGAKRIELIVTDGKVLVVDAADSVSVDDFRPPALFDKVGESVAVSKGEKVVFGAGDATVDAIDTTDIEASLSWRQGNLVFRGETLEEALAEISRYTDVEFFITDESIKKLRIAGMFKAGDVEGLLATLKQNFEIGSDRLGRNAVNLRSI